MANLNDLMIRIGVETADAISGFNEVAKGLDGVAAAAERNFAALDRIGDRLTGLGTALTASITAPLAAIGAAAAKAAMDFDEASDTIRAKTGATGEALQQMEAVFKNVFANVPNSAKEVTDAITTLSVGMNAAGKPLEDLSTQMLNLSRIMNESIAPLSQSVSKAFNDWSISTEEASSKLDYLFRTAQSTGVSITTLTTELKNFGSPMRALGLDFEQSAAMLATFEKAGVNLQTVMPGLRNAIKQFAGAGLEGADAFKAFIEKVKGLDDAQAALFTKTVVGGRAFVDMFRAIKEGRLDLDQLTASLKSGSDTINKAAEDTLSFADKFKRLRNEIEVSLEPLGKVLVGIGEKVLDGLTPLLGRVHDLAEAFAQMSPTTQAWALGIAAAAAAVGPLLIGIGAMANGLSALAPIFAMVVKGMIDLVTYISEVNPAMATVSAGAAALAIGLTAIGVAVSAIEIKGMISDFDELSKILDTVEQRANNSKDAFVGVQSGAKDTVTEIGLLSTVVRALNDLLKDFQDRVSGISFTSFLTPLGMLRDAFHQVVENLKILIGYYPEMDTAQKKLNASMMANTKTANDLIASSVAQAQAHKTVAAAASTATVSLDGLGKKHKEASDAAKEHTVNLEKLDAALTKFENQFLGTENVNLAEKLFSGFDASSKGAIDNLKELAAQYEVMRKAIVTTQEANAKFDMHWALEGIADVAQLANAFEHFGITSKLAFEDAAAAEQKTLDTILFSEKATLQERQQAQIAYYQAIIKLEEDSGRQVTEAQLNALANLKAAYLKATGDLQASFKTLNIVNTEDLKRQATEADAALQNIVDAFSRGRASIGDVQRAQLADMQIKAREMAAAGQPIPDAWKDTMARLAEVIANGNQTIKTRFDSFLGDVRNDLTKGFDQMWAGLLTGQMNFADALKSIWRDIANSIVKEFLNPIDQAIARWVTNQLKSLIGLDEGFKTIAKSAKDAASQVKDAIGVDDESGISGAGSATSGAGGSIASAGGGLMGILGLVTGGISAISNVVSNFQFAHMNTALGRIEESTRKTWIVTGEQSDSILKTLHDSRAFLDDIRNRVAEIRPALFDPVAISIIGIYDFLAQTMFPWMRENLSGGGNNSDQTTREQTSEVTAEVRDSAREILNGVTRSISQLGDVTYTVGTQTTSTLASAVAISQVDSATMIADDAANNTAATIQTTVAGDSAIIAAVGSTTNAVTEAAGQIVGSVEDVRAQLEDLGSTFNGEFFNTTQQYDDLKKTLIGKPMNGDTFAGVSPLNGWVPGSPLPNPYWTSPAATVAPKNEGPATGSTGTVAQGFAGKPGWTNSYSDTPTGGPSVGAVAATVVTPTAATLTDKQQAQAALDQWVADWKKRQAEVQAIVNATGDQALQQQLDDWVASQKEEQAKRQAAIDDARTDAQKQVDDWIAANKAQQDQINKALQDRTTAFLDSAKSAMYDTWAADPNVVVRRDSNGKILSVATVHRDDQTPASLPAWANPMGFSLGPTGGANSGVPMSEEDRQTAALAAMGSSATYGRNPFTDGLSYSSTYGWASDEWLAAVQKMTATLDVSNKKDDVTINVNNPQIFDLTRDAQKLAQIVSDQLKRGSSGLLV